MKDAAKIEQRGGETIRRGAYPELTWTAVFVGWFLGAIIAVSISYAALILGFSIEGSELAAILGWGILRGMMGRTSIVENNINQTIASAVNGASSGIMFSVPALFILSRKPGLESVADFNVPLMIAACIAGAFVGLAFVIPLRKQMIDFQRLPFPSGIAVATILKSPGAGLRKAMLLIGAGLFSAVIALALEIYFDADLKDAYPLQRMLNNVGLSDVTIPSMLNLTFFLSLMTIGVGFLSGKGGFWFGAGGFICYWLLSPILSQFGGEEIKALVPDPNAMRGAIYKPTGIGMLIGAAIGGIITAFPLIASAIKSMQRAGREKSSIASAADDEMPVWLLFGAIVVGFLLLILLAYLSVPNMSIGLAVVMAVLGTVWIWIAGVIVAECVGRTNWSPLSGMTLIAVTILIVICVRAGMESQSLIICSMVVGAAICLAISQASDMMLDLKSGYLVGAVPRRQQMAQFIGAWLGPIIVIALMFVLQENAKDSGGIGGDKLPAAQASALASVIEGIVEENVPAYRYVAGSGLGFLLAASGLGGIGVMVALGFYMPFNIVMTYTIGCLLRIIVDNSAGKRFSEEVGIPLAAGLIIGEALVGVGVAMVHVGKSFLG
jgi:putative OPT family oligopeptide transporter